MHFKAFRRLEMKWAIIEGNEWATESEMSVITNLSHLSNVIAFAM